MARDCDQTEDGVNSNCFSSVLLGTNLSQKCFVNHFFPLISVLQLPQEWSHFPGLQGAQKGERAALLHLRESWSHGP